MKLIPALILLVSFSTTSCHKHSSAAIKGDYMIVGWTGGIGGYGVHNYYLINQGQVMKDVSKWNTLPDNINGFSFTAPGRPTLYDSVKDLLTSIPSELLTKNNQDIGVNPGVDMGFTDVRTTINGVAYRWTFEPDQSASSLAVQQFYTKANLVFH